MPYKVRCDGKPLVVGIINGHPISCGCHSYDGYHGIDNELLSDLNEKDQAIVKEWICENIEPRKTFNELRTSYGIKHILQYDTGIYLTNNQFKDAMLQLGYYPKDERELNWIYRISKKSKAFKSRRL